MHIVITAVPGGYCSNSGVKVPGKATIQQTIAAPSGVSRLLKQVFSVAAGTGAPKPRSKTPEPTPAESCDMFIGVVTESPSGGFGTGKVKRVKFNADGSWYSTGSDVAVVFPKV